MMLSIRLVVEILVKYIAVKINLTIKSMQLKLFKTFIKEERRLNI